MGACHRRSKPLQANNRATSWSWKNLSQWKSFHHAVNAQGSETLNMNGDPPRPRSEYHWSILPLKPTVTGREPRSLGPRAIADTPLLRTATSICGTRLKDTLAAKKIAIEAVAKKSVTQD
jgi:hypothetical protein